jgi:biotin synthase
MTEEVDKRFEGRLPKLIRVSTGSAVILKLLGGRLDAAPTTAYLMTYRQSKCAANCGFCPQARTSHGRADMLSRVTWPAYSTELVINGIEKAFKNDHTKRVCIQALNYPDVFTHLLALAKAISQCARVPLSICCQPLKGENIRQLADAGIERIGIPLDAATEGLFDRIKGPSAGGPYRWNKQLELLKEAVQVFWKGRVSTHLIIGLGESEMEMVNTIQECVDMAVLPALFAFTPIPGTALEGRFQPTIQSYRRIQIARHLILHAIARCENMSYDSEGRLTDFGIEKETLTSIIQTGQPFLTSGCPNCNRPYYNEKPTGPIYNYPKRFTEKELSQVKKELASTVE